MCRRLAVLQFARKMAFWGLALGASPTQCSSEKVEKGNQKGDKQKTRQPRQPRAFFVGEIHDVVVCEWLRKGDCKQKRQPERREFLVFALQKCVDALSGCLWRGGAFVWAKMSAVWFKGSLKGGKSVFRLPCE